MNCGGKSVFCPGTNQTAQNHDFYPEEVSGGEELSMTMRKGYPVTAILNQSDPEHIWNKIKNYEVISFDLFDTLIKRNAAHPGDIFDIVQERFLKKYGGGICAFREKRVKAERTAREKKPGKEVSLRQIYDQLETDDDKKQELGMMEIHTEIDFCEPAYMLRELFYKCISSGKRTVITSDMYLPQVVIEQMLERCGYRGYYKLYLSSGIGFQKSTGRLYDYLLKDLGIGAKNLVHIGDAKKTDHFIAWQKGIRTVYVRRELVNTIFLDRNDIFHTGHCLFPYINNVCLRYIHESQVFRWGYETLGPLLAGFTIWVHEQLQRHTADKVFFLARDMYLFRQVYQTLYGSKVTYLEVSRRSLREAYILKKGDFSAVVDTLSRKTYSMDYILKAVGLCGDSIERLCRSEGITFSKDDDFETFCLHPGYRRINEILLAALKEKENNTISYLNQMGVTGGGRKVIVDIGWHGTIQNMLEEITARPFTGLYFGDTRRSGARKRSSYGYWFQEDNEQRAFRYISMITILEVFLFPRKGTVTGYHKKDGRIFPCHDEVPLAGSRLVSEFQKGALRFIDDYAQSPLAGKPVPASAAVSAFMKLAFAPAYSQAKRLSGLEIEDGTTEYLARVKHLGHYVLFPKEFIMDYRASKWKVGFLKSVFPFVKDVYGIDQLIKKRRLLEDKLKNEQKK